MATVVLPVVARGAVVRRPRAVALAEWTGADARAVRWMQRLRDRYGPGPVRVWIPGRELTVVLSPEHVQRVLAGTPRPFTAATREKSAAPAHFQPEGVLISDPEERARRRPFNETVLDTGSPVHRLAGPISVAVAEEAERLVAEVDRVGELTWGTWSAAWWRAIRRVVLGDAARDDEDVTDDLLRLRRRANHSFLAPSARTTRRRFLQRMADHVQAAEPRSLAGLAAGTPAAPGTEPHQQIPQWLFAFDAMTWASFRALALLAAHPDAVPRARTELPAAPDLPYLRAVLLESLRLWPTTPAILRDTTEATRWESGVLPAGASVLGFTPFFHRDSTRLPEAHRFTPELWLRGRTGEDWPLVPFSAGPGTCPGRDVVLLAGSVLLAVLVQRCGWRLVRGQVAGDRPMPGTLDPFGLRFEPRPL
ncbi:cytochrome P450 [Geodermatophilus sp. SYSU D00697]